MKITLPRVPTRNPLVSPCRQRHAGAHGPSTGAKRQRNARELRRELERMGRKERPPTPMKHERRTQCAQGERHAIQTPVAAPAPRCAAARWLGGAPRRRCRPAWCRPRAATFECSPCGSTSPRRRDPAAPRGSSSTPKRAHPRVRCTSTASLSLTWPACVGCNRCPCRSPPPLARRSRNDASASRPVQDRLAAAAGPRLPVTPAARWCSSPGRARSWSCSPARSGA